MLNLNGIKELVEVLAGFLPDRRKQAKRKYKLENELLKVRIQKTLAETMQMRGEISQAKLKNFNKALDVVNKNFPTLPITSKLNLAFEILYRLDNFYFHGD